MAKRPSSLLTTGQAARLCEVTPDTILKWIRKGRLRGARTAGGHYRIDPRDLQPHIPRNRLGDFSEATPSCFPQPLRCWEYLSDQGAVREDCKRCVVYRVGATQCFLLAGAEGEAGRGPRRQRSCDDCVYYRRVHGLPTNVLVVASDEGVLASPAGEKREGVAMRFAGDAYNASATIQDFRPAFAVIDEAILSREGSDLLSSLGGDPRVPGLKIILAVPRGGGGRMKDRPGGKAIVRILEKPVTAGQIADVINSFPVSPLVGEDGVWRGETGKEER